MKKIFKPLILLVLIFIIIALFKLNYNTVIHKYDTNENNLELIYLLDETIDLDLDYNHLKQRESDITANTPVPAAFWFMISGIVGLILFKKQ